MTKEEDDGEQYERDLADFKEVHKFYRPRIDRAERYYSQALTSLWLGNGGAALATLSFIGGIFQKGEIQRPIVPLWLFVFGLISMGLGSVMSLIQEVKSINRMQSVTSVLDFMASDIKSSTEEAGLTWDWRTRMAVLSAICFVLGCIVGLFDLSFSN